MKKATTSKRAPKRRSVAGGAQAKTPRSAKPTKNAGQQLRASKVPARRPKPLAAVPWPALAGLLTQADLVVRRVLARLPSSPRPGEPALLLSIATLVIGLALVLLRGSHSPTPQPDAAYLALTNVSMQAYTLPPAPKPAPKVRAPHAAFPIRLVVPASPMSREEGIKVVLATARSLIGTPYRYGAAGPIAFDCSGFTSFVWRAAGLSLPHNSGAQFGSLPRVPISSLQPGDLVFSGSGRVGHVGLYIGNGLMINSPETGRSVQIDGLRENLIGAARPALLLRPSPAAN